jgi:hypothetical protein
MEKILLITILGLFVCCDSNPKQDILSRNFSRTGCVGLTALGKVATPDIITIDTASYCAVERLYWKLDAGVLKLNHTRWFSQCDAKLSMEVIKDGSNYVVREADNSKGPPAMCSCPFDTYCEVPLSDIGTISIVLSSKTYQINLYDKSGIIVIDTSSHGSFECMHR